MRYLGLTFLIFSFHTYACWKVEGKVSVNGDSTQFNQKFNHDKTYSFQAKDHLFHIKIPSKFDLPPQMKASKDVHLIEVQVLRKEGIKLTEVSRGKMWIRSGNEASMTEEDEQTKTLSTFNFKITDI